MNRAVVEREAFQANSTDYNDCTVCALTNALDIPYALAYERMENFGRKYGKGSPITFYLDQFPKDYIRIQLPAGMRYQVRDFCNNEGRYGRYIVLIDKHCFAVIDGEIQDIQDLNEEAYVKAAYKVQIETEEITATRQLGKYKVDTSLKMKCQECNKVAEVANEFKVATMTFTTYKCGHTVMNARKAGSRFDEIKAITN